MSKPRTALLTITAGIWIVSILIAIVDVAVDGWASASWMQLLVNAAGPMTVIAALWPRTVHPNDAYELGLIDGARLEREKYDRHPRSGELRVVR